MTVLESYKPAHKYNEKKILKLLLYILLYFFGLYYKPDVHVLYKAHHCPLVSTNLLDRWPNKMLECGNYIKHMCFIFAYLSNIDPKEQQGEVPCGEQETGTDPQVIDQGEIK